MTQAEIDKALWTLDNAVRQDPALVKSMKTKFNEIVGTARNVQRLDKLKRCKGWGNMPVSVMEDLCTEESAPFVIIMLGLSQRGHSCNQLSLVSWWRRMIATGQSYLITYFSWESVADLRREVPITGQDLMKACAQNKDTFENITNAYTSDKSVEYRIRELLGGLSMQADVPSAWKEWAKKNHPDKGGDHEVFVRTKIVYETWCQLHEHK